MSARPIRIAPSILASNFSKLGQEVRDVVDVTVRAVAL